MMDVESYDKTAFVGISFSDRVIYNLVEREGEFEYTGRSIISLLRNERNYFMSKIIESQSYQSIKVILDDEIIFGEFIDKQNMNIETFHDIYSYIHENNSIDYYYIYDVLEDMLLIKEPNMPEIIAVDYKNSYDVREFINTIK